ncbi:MAG: adenosylmethionine decarboxylase [Methylotenera sp.]|nr:adenosylmethionine decarboxylase [Methylotenera sp.]NOT65207.1 adenosylmethionine decarboxylase [Methylotenera sp.]
MDISLSIQPLPAKHSGLHLMANLYQVSATPAMLDAQQCRVLCQTAVSHANLTMVGDFFHGFDEGGGVTGVVVLAESHLAIHTWPESNYVTLDVFVCNYNQDNTANARALFEALISHFSPAEVKRFETERG